MIFSTRTVGVMTQGEHKNEGQFGYGCTLPRGRSRAFIDWLAGSYWQYTSHRFRAVLARYGCIQSMSRKGNLYDNAVMESFYRTLKKSLFRVPITTTQNKLRLIFSNILKPTITQSGFILPLAGLVPSNLKRKILNFVSSFSWPDQRGLLYCPYKGVYP